MRIFLLFITLATCIFPLMAQGNIPPHKAYFDEYLPTLSLKLKYGEFPGPIGPIMAQWALGRQVLEDGISRRRGESCAGISRVGFNAEALKKAVGRDNISISLASDGEGTFYMLHGHYANIYSATTIAYLFDTYVGKFLKREKRQWAQAKETSKAIQMNPDSFELNHRFYCILKPDNIIKKCNRIYGPQSGAVENLTKIGVMK